MKDITDALLKLSKLPLLSEVTTVDKGARCNLRFHNPNGLGEIEIEFDYNLAPEELAIVNLNLPIQEEKRAETLAILKGAEAQPVEAEAIDIKP